MYHRLLNWFDSHLLPCPVKWITGHDCPGCGMQRAFIELFRGNILESIHHHPGAIPLLVMMAYLALHLRFRFPRGPKVLLVMYLSIACLSFANYILKIMLGTW